MAPPPAPHVERPGPAEFRDPSDLWIGNNLHLLVILQNTKLVPSADGPKSWADLLDPKWKGKIAFTDPANSGSAYATVTMLVDLWGAYSDSSQARLDVNCITRAV